MKLWGGGGRGGWAWGGHLIDLVLPGEGIFRSFLARRGDI